MSDTPQLLLVHYLKALRLPTFLREYDNSPSNAPPRTSTILAICCVWPNSN
jgi:hypothetical protein